jgi:hypothetical protein
MANEETDHMPEEKKGADPVVAAVHQANLEEAKGTQGVFDLPCGFMDQAQVLHKEVHVREITGVEEDMLGSKSVPHFKKITKLINGCVQKLGPYQGKDLEDIGEKLLVGDRVFLMFAIRRVSLGDAYPFRGHCPNEDCKYDGLFTLDLSVLEDKSMADPSKRIFDVKLPSGKKVRWRPLTGADEEQLSKAKDKNEGRSMSMLLRTLMIDDQPPTEYAIKSMGLGDRNALWDDFEENEGGVETTMEMQCPICLHEWEEDLDVAQVGFFFPSSALKTLKKKSST